MLWFGVWCSGWRTTKSCPYCACGGVFILCRRLPPLCSLEHPFESCALIHGAFQEIGLRPKTWSRMSRKSKCEVSRLMGAFPMWASPLCGGGTRQPVRLSSFLRLTAFIN
ncbi:hypothetical protein OF83DRAFT_363433 [Amylostereum chailletii]|nr:hypothetical protein OF83DRAFT_363433 [Amylostereum chailletii]